MAKCTKGNRRIADIRSIGKSNFQERNITDYRSRDRGNQQKDGACEEQESAEVVENACLMHLGG